MISYGKQSIDEKDINEVIKVLKSDWLTQGPSVDKFEAELAEYFGSNYACAVSNGTAALHLAGLALGWEKNDIIITSPITFLATANSILYCGASPKFADIDPESFTIDPNNVEDIVKNCLSKGKKVKGIIGVDFAGHPCDWKSLKEISEKFEIPLINDNCHALGASYNNSKKYAVDFADIVTQSFHPVKHITTGEGGAILCNDFKINEKIRLLRTHGMTKESNKINQKQGTWYYEMHELGYNYRITDFQCALGSSQLKKLGSFIQKRQEIALNYTSAFSKNDIFLIPNTKKRIEHAFHLYCLRVDFDKLRYNKKSFFEQMKNFNINLQVHYIPVHLQPFYKKHFGTKEGDFPISENFYSKEVSLPIYPDLTKDEQDYVINNILKLTNE